MRHARSALRAQCAALGEVAGDAGNTGDTDISKAEWDRLRRSCVAAVLRAVDGETVPEDQALRVAVRFLLDRLAETAGGGSVEVRVPPVAVTQCVPGPRHTRGTPPNVVETDPHTWFGLATGRLGWADGVATGRVHASGRRSDLSPYLPVWP